MGFNTELSQQSQDTNPYLQRKKVAKVTLVEREITCQRMAIVNTDTTRQWADSKSLSRRLQCGNLPSPPSISPDMMAQRPVDVYPVLLRS